MPVPSTVAPSLSVTVPVGVPEPVAGFTVAVNVTADPKIDGLFDETTEVESPTLFTVCTRGGEVLPVNKVGDSTSESPTLFTVCTRGGEVLPAKFASPL